MVDAPDVTGGGTQADIGFQVTDVTGKAVAGQFLVELAAFDDTYCSVPAANATLDTAASGSTIVGGSGTAAIKVLTGTDGSFGCKLNNPSDTTITLSCYPTFGGPALVCHDKDFVTFSA
jgi:hypothetical protein